MEVELITVRPHGFVPAEITRPQGRFLLGINNRSGLEEVDLRLFREAGGVVREVRVNRKKPDWRELVNLPPGRYVLKEAARPGWACRITIMPR